MILPDDTKAVLFDMDGVLIDSEYQWRRLSKEQFERLIPGWSEKDFKRVVGLGVEELYRLLATEYGLKLSREDCLRSWEEVAVRVYGREVALADRLPEVLGALDERGIAAGLVTSSPRRWIRIVLDRFGLAARFKVVVSADDVGGVGKPDPAVYRLALERTAVAPSSCVAVEDSAHGLAAARAAGLRVVAYRNGHNAEQDLSGADWEIHGFRDLLAART